MGQAKRRGTFEERRDLALDLATMRKARDDAQADREYEEQRRVEERQRVRDYKRGTIGRGGLRGLTLAAAALAGTGAIYCSR